MSRCGWTTVVPAGLPSSPDRVGGRGRGCMAFPRLEIAMGDYASPYPAERENGGAARAVLFRPGGKNSLTEKVHPVKTYRTSLDRMDFFCLDGF